MEKTKLVDSKKFTCIEFAQKLLKTGHIILTKSNAFKKLIENFYISSEFLAEMNPGILSHPTQSTS